MPQPSGQVPEQLGCMHVSVNLFHFYISQMNRDTLTKLITIND